MVKKLILDAIIICCIELPSKMLHRDNNNGRWNDKIDLIFKNFANLKKLKKFTSTFWVAHSSKYYLERKSRYIYVNIKKLATHPYVNLFRKKTIFFIYRSMSLLLDICDYMVAQSHSLCFYAAIKTLFVRYKRGKILIRVRIRST